jgi:proteasome lid subunit RPN8/RPN11
MLVSEPLKLTIKIPRLVWAAALRDLRRSGRGRRESGAFLIGAPGIRQAQVTDYVCYDTLDTNAYQNGVISFHDTGYAALWDLLKKRQVEVLADVHTHGGADVRQSSIDRRHPMMPVIGHTAMIVPHFAKTSIWSLNAVGVYEYLGKFEWQTHNPSRDRRVKLSLW